MGSAPGRPQATAAQAQAATPRSRAVLSLRAEELLSWLAVEKGRSPNTLVAYRRDLAAYEAWALERGCSERLEESVLAEYVGHLQGSGLAPASVARAVVAVRSLYRFVALEGAGSEGAGSEGADGAGWARVPSLRPPKVPQGIPKALSEQEVSALLGAVTGDGPLALRDRAVLEVLYATGVRISELTGLCLGDLVVDEQLARVVGKGNKERLVPLGRYAREALAAWLGPGGRSALVPRHWAARTDADAVFLNRKGGRLTRQGAWLVVRRYGALVGLAGKLSPHVLRHSCATHMLDHGADIRVVQELLGHVSVNTTQVYTKVSQQRLKSVYLTSHPRARDS